MKKYILIADPSKVSRFVLENYLREKYKILTASSYSEATDILNKFIFSLVIVSYELKDGFGFDLCRYIQKKEKLRSVPVILLSSNEEDERYRFKAFEVGAIDFIRKSQIDENFAKYIDEIIEVLSISDISGSTALIVDDSLVQLKFIENILKSTGINVYSYSKPSEMLNEIKSRSPDIIITDLFMEETDGIDLTKKLRKIKALKHVPILIQTSSRENSFLRALLLHGANDYILKPFSAEEAILRVTSNIKTKKLYDDLEETNRELFKKATTDSLTGLYNRRFFMEQLENINYNAGRYGHNFAVVLWDIDRFKEINDSYGHDTGDKVLMELSSAIRNMLRKSDIMGRFGGEEFLCLFPGQEEINFPRVVGKLLDIARSLDIYAEDNEKVKVTISIGAMICDRTYESLDNIIKTVDELMYKAKNNGRNRAYIKLKNKILEIS